MSSWNVSDGGKQFGPYTEEAIAAYYREGRISADAHVWREGMAEWQPIRTQFPHLAPPPPPPPAALQCVPGNEAAVISKIVTYQRLSGWLWLGIAILQIISLVAIIAGIWNVIAGISRLASIKDIEARKSTVPAMFDGVVQLIIIGLINLLLGGVIGVAFVALDFYIRQVVLDNAHIFCRSEEAAVGVVPAEGARQLPR